jgi:hypothetical protein
VSVPLDAASGETRVSLENEPFVTVDVIPSVVAGVVSGAVGIASQGAHVVTLLQIVLVLMKGTWLDAAITLAIRRHSKRTHTYRRCVDKQPYNQSSIQARTIARYNLESRRRSSSRWCRCRDMTCQENCLVVVDIQG